MMAARQGIHSFPNKKVIKKSSLSSKSATKDHAKYLHQIVLPRVFGRQTVALSPSDQRLNVGQQFYQAAISRNDNSVQISKKSHHRKIRAIEASHQSMPTSSTHPQAQNIFPCPTKFQQHFLLAIFNMMHDRPNQTTIPYINYLWLEEKKIWIVVDYNCA